VETGNLMIDAQYAFARERRRRRYEELRQFVLRRAKSNRLVWIGDEIDPGAPASRRELGLRSIPLDSIVGSAECGKAKAFDSRFRAPSTSRSRWERLWMAERRGSPVPPISVYRVGDEHYVDDGHHRVSVAHALGMDAIDAEVTALSPAAAA
jgi:hypothetical protein